MPIAELLKKHPGAFPKMWAVVYFRELAEPLSEVNPNLMEIIFNFANTFTEETVLHSYTKMTKEKESGPSAEMMRRLGYTEKDIAGMELNGSK